MAWKDEFVKLKVSIAGVESQISVQKKESDSDERLPVLVLGPEKAYYPYFSKELKESYRFILAGLYFSCESDFNEEFINSLQFENFVGHIDEVKSALIGSEMLEDGEKFHIFAHSAFSLLALKYAMDFPESVGGIMFVGGLPFYSSGETSTSKKLVFGEETFGIRNKEILKSLALGDDTYKDDINLETAHYASFNLFPTVNFSSKEIEENQELWKTWTGDGKRLDEKLETNKELSFWDFYKRNRTLLLGDTSSLKLPVLKDASAVNPITATRLFTVLEEERIDFREQLDSISAPVMLLFGARDAMCPFTAWGDLNALPKNFDYYIFIGDEEIAGHLLYGESETARKKFTSIFLEQENVWRNESPGNKYI